MMKSLSIGILILGCCLAAVAQMGSTPNQTPPASTPSTFPQDQTGQTPANPTQPSDPSAIPPDISARPIAAQSSQASNFQTSVQGCLSLSSDGNFTLADNSGTRYQLRGDSSQLGAFVGTMIAVDGTITTSSGSAGAMASPTSSDSPGSPASGRQLSVSNVRKISDSCATSSTTTK